MGMHRGSCWLLHHYLKVYGSLVGGEGGGGVQVLLALALLSVGIWFIGGGWVWGAQGVLMALALLSIGIWFLGWGGTGGPAGSCTIIYRYMVPWLGAGGGGGGAQGVLLALALLSIGVWFLGWGVGEGEVHRGSCWLLHYYLLQVNGSGF